LLALRAQPLIRLLHQAVPFLPVRLGTTCVPAGTHLAQEQWISLSKPNPTTQVVFNHDAVQNSVGQLFGPEPARELGEHQLANLVDPDLPTRMTATGRGEPSGEVVERVHEEVRTICEHGLGDLLLFAHEVGQFCSQHSTSLAARCSDTAGLVIWALGLPDRPSGLRPRRSDVPPTTAARICRTLIWKSRQSTRSGRRV
jgi:hypothetical protein